MNNDIKSAVSQHPKLTLQVNQGERHRIIRSGPDRGSLWVAPRVNGYQVLVTGIAEALLYSFLCTHFGRETGENQGNKYWNIENIGEVTKIIRHFGEQ